MKQSNLAMSALKNLPAAEAFPEAPKPETKPVRSESAESARRKVERYHSASKLIRSECRGSTEMLCWEDVELGRLIGKGGFSCVYEATLRRDRVHRKPLYAVKCLRETVTQHEDTFIAGAVDLALEASILSKLVHVNVIRVHGYRSGCISESFNETERGFFLVLDMLSDTCDKRIDRWCREKSLLSTWSRRKSLDKLRLRERIEDVALGSYCTVCNAMGTFHN